MSDMNQSDHDALIKVQSILETQVAASREVTAGLATLAEKLDQMRDAMVKQAYAVDGLKSRQADMDIRVATLTQQVDTLRDDAEKAKAIADAMTKASERLAKRWAIVSGVIVFVISNGPTLLAWLQRIINPSTP